MEVKTDQRELVRNENNYYYVQPRCDIRETKDHYHLLLEMPGVNKETLSVQVKNNQLLIDGKMSMDEDGALIRSEIPKRNYRRVFTLGKTVDSQNVDAKWKDGILILKLIKKEEAKPREIKINFN